MPRDGSGIYSKAAGSTASPNTTIESAKYNATIDDLVTDANAARPITAGGTAATTAVGAADALSPDFVIVASAATCDIGAASSPNVNITGTTTITGLGTKTAGAKRFVKFAGALTLTHNGTSLILPGAANITTAAGDTAIFVSEGSGNWRCVVYQRAALKPFSESSAKFWADIRVSGGVPSLAASFNVTSVTDTSVGQVTVTIATDFASGNWACMTGIQANATTVIANYSSKAAGAIIIQSLSLADALVDPAAYSIVGFGDQ